MLKISIDKIDNMFAKIAADMTLYMPVDGSCKVFGMKWAYAARNNFITVECSNESHPVPHQP